MTTHSAIGIFIYKRPQNIARLAAVLKSVRPSQLFIIADGPKNQNEAAIVKRTREELAACITWPCQVYKNYAKENLGLKERFRTGIDWVFTRTDRAIFLEDDCLPDVTFFRFCDELLKKYQDEPRVMTISGNNFEFGKNNYSESYHFSRYPHIWGWATWRRAWRDYDADIVDWPKRRNTPWLQEVTGSFLIAKFWKYMFDRLYRGEVNTWDYQVAYASFKIGSLHIVPARNLVTNVGYGQESTNIRRKNKTLDVPAVPMHFPLIHPRSIVGNQQADQAIENLVYLHPLGKISLMIKSLFGIL